MSRAALVLILRFVFFCLHLFDARVDFTHQWFVSTFCAFCLAMFVWRWI